MRKLISKGFLLISFTTTYTFSQENLVEECQKHINNAVHYFSNTDYIADETITEITAWTKNCIDDNDPETLFVRGMLYVYDVSLERQQEGFELIKLSSQNGYTEASYTLGLLYKNGIGCNLDFEKAYHWYEQAASLGHQKAAFNLGYMSFKGLGTVDQSYEKAVEWFEKSDHQLAQHWLAVCYLYGYGVEKDIAVAKALLAKNYIVNSKILLKQIYTIESAASQSNESNSEDSINDTSEKVIERSNDKQSFSKLNVSDNDLSGTYHGTLVQYDWSLKNIKRSIPISLSIDYSRYTNELEYSLIMDEQEFNGIATFYQNNIIFDDLKIVIPKIWEEMDNPVKDMLDLEILSVSLMSDKQNNNTIIGNVDTRVAEWNEPGLPTKLALVKESDTTISQEALIALSSQENDFIKLYPVPFKDNLLISYQLENNAKISVEISELHGYNTKVIAKNTYRQSGEQIHHFDGSKLAKGVYIIRVIIGNKQYTKLVIKE